MARKPHRGTFALIAVIVAVVAWGLDNDKDRMDDQWEAMVGLNPASKSDAKLNPDGDTLINAQESLILTDPFLADTDMDGLADGVDPDPLSQAVILWGSDRFTKGDEYFGPGPRWWLGAAKSGGLWNPEGWHVPASETNPCALFIYLDPAAVSSLLSLTVTVATPAPADLRLDLLDETGALLAADVSGNLASGRGGTSTRALPLPLATNAATLRIRRVAGCLTVCDTLIGPDQRSSWRPSTNLPPAPLRSTNDVGMLSLEGYVAGGGQLEMMQSLPGGDDLDNNELPDSWQEWLLGVPAGAGGESLVGWWKFDDAQGTTAANAVGSQYTGELINMPANAWEAGAVRGALRFDGVDDLVRVPQNPALIAQGPFTVAAWVKLDADWNDEFPTAIADIGVVNWNYSGFWLGADGYNLCMEGLVADGTASYAWPSAGPLATDGWTHLALSWANGFMHVYRNGVEVATPVAIQFVAAAKPYLYIGWGDDPSFTYYWKGLLDDVRVYTAALGPSDIYATMLPALDSDGDGLTNLEEYEAGTYPNDPDFDGDGLTDYEEVRVYDSNPYSPHSDDDGLDDYSEAKYYYTHPALYDTDGDGLSDYDEAITYQSYYNYWGCFISPTSPDTDGDGLGDYEEVIGWYSNPCAADTDGDGMPDGWEVTYGLNPLLPGDGGEDPDSDGLGNSDEFLYGAHIFSYDSDNDGLLDGYEVHDLGTSPTSADTDGDGMPDGWEVQYGLNPTLDDSSADADGDGISNVHEYIQGGNPTLPRLPSTNPGLNVLTPGF